MIEATIKAIDALPAFDWASHGIDPPREDSIRAAKEFVSDKCAGIPADQWKEPWVSNDNGDVCVGWIIGARRATIYFNEGEVWWCNSEMGSTIECASDWFKLWDWLIGGDAQ